ncbi:holliday junction DNA helicase RuvA [Mycobacteroides abscessus subsp. abscessus]|nr:holliday junction DNA helicase RuvA [Mycobacteroides abscessus subsp. abscessus]
MLELREKVAAAPGGTTELGRGTASLVRSQVVEALIGLGFAAKQAEQATDTVLAQDNPGDTGADVSGVLRSALALLGKTR